MNCSVNNYVIWFTNNVNLRMNVDEATLAVYPYF